MSRDYPSDLKPRSNNGKSVAQASGSRGTVMMVTDNPTSFPPDLGPLEDDVAFSDDASDLCDAVTSLQREKGSLAYELVWVMREALPQMVGRVLTSQEFEDEMGKVRSFLVDIGRELGRRESGDLSLSMASGENRAEPDPTILEKIEKV
nr:hypothetical protein [Tanacetum cinerariifolium]